MKPKQLTDLGIAMYGEKWKTSMANDIRCSVKSVTRWSNGSWPVPPWAIEEILRLARYYSGLLEGRQNKILNIIERIK